MRFEQKPFTGVGIALMIFICWAAHLFGLLQWNLNWFSPWTYLGILIQTHLYTGLFITAHDAIHGVVAPQHPKLNRALGFLAATLFAYNSYALLEKKHHQHHRHVNQEEDPDVHQGPFLLWWFKFMWEYIRWPQVLLMAITYNVLKLWIPMENLILFWELPAILATLQLFYFGTYLPHKNPHASDNPHQSRSQAKNHVWAFLSCYFFGYHFEHHAWPYLPWWKLPMAKEQNPNKA